MTKTTVISHVIALILGLLGGFLGRDLTGLQKPVEEAITAKVDAGEPTIVYDGGLAK